MIIETIVTTMDQAGVLNIAPMGPWVAEGNFGAFELRPFQTSKTFENLTAAGQGVVHVSDDVELFARAALDQIKEAIPTKPAKVVRGQVLVDCCSWFEFETVSVFTSRDRAEITCRTCYEEHLRPFIGFNRAQHAVIEATILATRLSFLPNEAIVESLPRLKKIVEKTGGDREKRAWEFVAGFIETSEVQNRQPNMTP